MEGPENGDNQRSEPERNSQEEAPSPVDYDKLRAGANELRETKLSGRSVREVKRRKIQSGMHNYIRYTGIGLQFVVVVLLALGAGYGLDYLLGTTPWLMVVGAIAGCVGAMVYVVWTVFRMESSTKDRTGK